MAADTAHFFLVEAKGCNGLDPVPLHAFIRMQRARPGSKAYRLMVLVVDHLACVRDARAPPIIFYFHCGYPFSPDWLKGREHGCSSLVSAGLGKSSQSIDLTPKQCHCSLHIPVLSTRWKRLGPKDTVLDLEASRLRPVNTYITHSASIMCVCMHACAHKCKHVFVRRISLYLCVFLCLYLSTSVYDNKLPNRCTSVPLYLHRYTCYPARHLDFFLMCTFHITPCSEAVVQLNLRHSLKIIQ